MIQLIYFVVLWLNDFPNTQGISEKHPPREIVTDRELVFNKHFKTEFGYYVETSKDTAVKNNTKTQTHAYIALGSSGNL